MRSFLSFAKKECMEQLRSFRLMILGLLFLLFGVMNPAIAKLTPWLMELLEESLAASGLNMTLSAPTALDSWAQFFKNIPMALIAFVIMQSNVFTKEYQSGTLVLSLTKGLPRHIVVLAKTAVLATVFSLGYWLSFLVTYLGNLPFFDNALAQHLGFSALCWWVFGLLIVALMVLFSVLSRSMGIVLLGTGGTVLALYLVGLLPRVGEVMPTFLMNGTLLVYGMKAPRDFLAALIVTAVACLVCIAVSIPLFNKKQL